MSQRHLEGWIFFFFVLLPHMGLEAAGSSLESTASKIEGRKKDLLPVSRSWGGAFFFFSPHPHPASASFCNSAWLRPRLNETGKFLQSALVGIGWGRRASDSGLCCSLSLNNFCYKCIFFFPHRCHSTAPLLIVSLTFLCGAHFSQPNCRWCWQRRWELGQERSGARWFICLDISKDHATSRFLLASLSVVPEQKFSGSGFCKCVWGAVRCASLTEATARDSVFRSQCLGSIGGGGAGKSKWHHQFGRFGTAWARLAAVVTGWWNSLIWLLYFCLLCTKLS